MKKRSLALLYLCTAASIIFAGNVLLEETGTLGGSGIRLDNGSHVDWYELRIDQPAILEVKVASVDFTPVALLRTLTGQYSSGESFPGNYAVVISPSEAAGLVQIGVAGRNSEQTGRYIFKVQEYTPPPPLEPGTSVSGNLASASGDAEGGDPTARHDMRVESGMLVEVVLQSDDFDAYLTVELPDGERLENDDSMDGSDSGLVVRVDQSGTMRIFVNAYEDDESGEYTLSARLFDPPETVEAEQTFDGNLSSDDRKLFSQKPVDWYMMHGSPDDAVTVTLSSGDFDTVLLVFFADGGYEEYDDIDDDTSNSEFSYEFSTGTPLMFCVTGYSEEDLGAYTLAVSSGSDASSPQASPEASGPDEGGVLDVDSFYERSLGAGDAVDSEDRYYDTYFFEGSEGEGTAIRMESEDVDSFLTLTDPEGRTISADDYDDSSNAQLMTMLPADGTYTVKATSYEGGETGDYTIVRAVVEGDHEVYTAELTADDTLDVSGKYYDEYTLYGTEGQEIAIRLFSDDFDSVLTLFSPSDELIETNDDISEDDSNSGIDIELQETGTYTIYALSYDAGETGEYRLVILKEPVD